MASDQKRKRSGHKRATSNRKPTTLTALHCEPISRQPGTPPRTYFFFRTPPPDAAEQKHHRPENQRRSTLLAVEDGYRESTESWARVLRDMKRRGLGELKLVVGGGAPGAWAALRYLYPRVGEQRCWFHASGNIVDCFAKRMQSKANKHLDEITAAPTRNDARAALEVFRDEYGAKHPKALAKLDRDWTQPTAFYDSPPSTGATYGPPTRSRARSPRFGCAPG